MSGHRNRCASKESIEARKARNAERLAKIEARQKSADDERKAILASLPDDERRIFEGLAATNPEGELMFPLHQFFENTGIHDLEQKRVVYLLFAIGIFSEIEPSQFFNRRYFLWWQAVGMCEAIGLTGGASRFKQILESLKPHIHGLQYCCGYAGAKEELEGIPFAFYICCNYDNYQAEPTAIAGVAS